MDSMDVEIKIIKNLEKPYAVIYTNQIDEETQKIVSMLDDIYLIRIENEKTVLYGKEKSYVSKKRLCELEKALKPNFMKISKTTLINLKYIEGMEASFGGMMLLIMKNGCKDYVSRKYLPDLKKYLGL